MDAGHAPFLTRKLGAMWTHREETPARSIISYFLLVLRKVLTSIAHIKYPNRKKL